MYPNFLDRWSLHGPSQGLAGAPGPEPPGPFSGTGGVVDGAQIHVGSRDVRRRPRRRRARPHRGTAGPGGGLEPVPDRQHRPAGGLRPGQPVSGVPVEVLLGVSYLESRWDDHGAPGQRLRRLRPDAPHPGRGRGARPRARRGQGRRVAGRARDRHAHRRPRRSPASPRDRLRSDDVANVCGGAAVLASYQPGTTLGPSGRVEQGGRRLRRHRRRRRTGWTSPGRSSPCSAPASPAPPTTASRSRSRATPGAAVDSGRRGRRRSRPATRSSTARPCPAVRVAPGAVRAVRLDAEPVRQPRPREPAAGRAEHRLHRHPRHRGLPGRPRSTWCRTRRTSPGTTRSAPPTATSPSTSTRRTSASTPATGTSTCTRSASSTRASRPPVRPGTPSRCTAPRPSW